MAERFGRYWLHEKIGHGGMAEIYRATIGPDSGTYAFELALKRMHAHLEDDPNQVDMFLTEADIAKFLQHPNLVRVFEAGLVDNRAYISMEYVWGHDMSRLITLLAGRGQRFPSDLAVHVGLQLLRAVDYVHRARSPGGVSMDLVHRDVTPSNLYLTLGGEVKLGDFGVARVSFLESEEEELHLKGKAEYMPPEVLAGDPVDQMVDLWGVASILYEMLTAKRVYTGVTEAELMDGQTPPVVPVENINPDIEPRLAKIVNNSLSPKPKKRPRDALSFYQQLKVYLQDNGIDVEPQGLARFVTEITGSPLQTAAESSQQSPDVSSFDLPDYQVPVGPSPTTRFLQRARKKARWRPIIAGGIVLMAALIGFAVYQTAGSSTADEPTDDAVAPVDAQDLGALAETGAADLAPEEVAPVDDLSAAADAGLDIDLDDVDTEAIEIDGAPLSHIKDPTTRFKALLHRGQVESKRGRHGNSLEAYQAASVLKPNDTRAKVGQARALLALSRFAAAEEQIAQVLDKRPRNLSAHLLLGDLASAEGELEMAREAYERCIKIDPSSAAARSARKALADLE